MSDAPLPPFSRSRIRFFRAEDRAISVLGWGLMLFTAVYFLLPIAISVIQSFNDSRTGRFPPANYSLRWYWDFFGSLRWTSALMNSLVIALGTMVLSTVTGVMVSWAFTRYRFALKGALYSVLIIPLFMPGVVLGLGIAGMFGMAAPFGLNLQGSRLLIIIAHSLWAMPLVVMLMDATFKTIDFAMIEAAADLGARPMRTFFEIVLPTVSTGILSACVMAFVLSLNEFYMALLLADRDSQTLPVLMWLSLRSGSSPVLSVAAVVLEVLMIVGMLGVALALRKRSVAVHAN
jgi:putative spermidine/putrescine transport system permease protein/spermidine/putrescine transport system permease protein